MSDMTEQEAWALDELLTKTSPGVDLSVQGPFIKYRNMMVILDQMSAQYLFPIRNKCTFSEKRLNKEKKCAIFHYN